MGDISHQLNVATDYSSPSNSHSLSLCFPPSPPPPPPPPNPLFVHAMSSGARGEEGAAPGGGSPAVAGEAAGDRASDRRVVRWERFLPRRSLRVLLVEHDDSTRHIVTALLRKCSYHVAAVADGLKAWEVMKERHYNVDLVLTEVAIPSITGIGLLSKIMGTEECKNIPVIMMSSHDSIGVVLNCMLKGAVDFLVKPVRKNELRNLWQHVWRKHCSSSYANTSDNNAASNHISANADDRSKTGENSDEETDAQSSGSKPMMEDVGIEKHLEPQLAEGSSFSREVEAKLEKPDSNIVMLASVSKMDDDKPVETGVEVTLSPQKASVAEKNREQNCSHDAFPYRREDLYFMRSGKGYNVGSKSYCQNEIPNEPFQDKIDLMEPITNEEHSSVLEKDAQKQDALVRSRSTDRTSPLWELSLRRPQLNGSLQQEFKERLLNHSNSSAFSRYGNKRIHPSFERLVSSASSVRAGECDVRYQSHADSHGTENEKNTPIPPKERLSSHQVDVGEATVCLQVSAEGKKEDAGLLSTGLPREDACVGHPSSEMDTVFRHPPYGFIPLPIPYGAAPYQSLCAGYGAILQPMFYPETSLSPHSSAAVAKGITQIPCDQPLHHGNHLFNNSRSNEFHHHEENHQSHHWRQPIDMEPRDPRNTSCTPMEQAYQSGSCSQDVLKGSGSYGSGEMTDAAVNTGAALESGNESGVQNYNMKGLDWDRSRREAALMKFRLKRKDRCFEKKVRYHSRKKLAEQRPRVKGQFVRQNIPDSMSDGEADY